MGAAPLLTILKDGETIKSQTLEGEMVLGRSEGCVIRLDDRAISRQHAVFRPVSGGVRVEKKSEFAPLSVNGLECTTALMKDGDVISIGPYLMKLSMNGLANAGSNPAAANPIQSAPGVAVAPVMLAEVPSDGSATVAVSEPGGVDENLLVMEPQASSPAFDESALGESSSAASNSVSIEVSPFEMDSGGAAEAAPIPVDLGEIVIDEEAKTRLVPAAKVSAKIVLPNGAANVTELEITKDEISIGRGKDCDIVLDDKKASRKHAIIRRNGISFSIKDLDSANGVYVNGLKVLEQDLSGDDILKIGNVEFRFLVLSSDYVENQDKFIPVPQELEDPAPMEHVMDFSQPEPMPEMATQPPLSEANALGGIAGISGMGTSGKKSLVEKFKAQPRPRQILIVLVLGLFLWWFMDDDDVSKAPPPKKPGIVATTKAGATFESLSPDQKKYVEAQHALAFDYYKNKEYDKSLFEVQKIFALIPDYKDSREIERYAKEGKRKAEAMEDERKKKEEEERLKVRITELVDQAKGLMQRKQYDQARELFSQIFALDPDNQEVSAWRKEVDQYEEQKRIEEQEKQVQREINIRAWDIYKDAMKLKLQKQYREAIATFKKVMDIGASDKKVEVAAKAGIKATQEEIISLRDPVLAEAKQAEDSQDLPRAFSLYKKSTEIDPPYPDGYAGMDRIRGILHDRAKALYIDAVLAESYSDFSVAKKKFQECRDVAPKDDIYHDRAERKLAAFFKQEEVPQ